MSAWENTEDRMSMLLDLFQKISDNASAGHDHTARQYKALSADNISLKTWLAGEMEQVITGQRDLKNTIDRFQAGGFPPMNGKHFVSSSPGSARETSALVCASYDLFFLIP